MSDSPLLTPVSEEDPCGPDLRWDADFLTLVDAMEAAVSAGDETVVDAQVVASTSEVSFEDIIDDAAKLLAKKKDLRLFAIHAEASWRQSGLAGFAATFESMAGAMEAWPAPDDGVHPRADEFDGDLGERAGALGRLVNRIPVLAATVGWGATPADRRLEAATLLRGVFGSWETRLGDALGTEVPASSDAWRGLQTLIEGLEASEPPAAGEADDAVSASFQPVSVDAWDLIDRAVEQMALQDHHSPALPILRMLASWRSLGIVGIVDGMKTSGVTLEQLMESVAAHGIGQASAAAVSGADCGCDDDAPRPEDAPHGGSVVPRGVRRSGSEMRIGRPTGPCQGQGQAHASRGRAAAHATQSAIAASRRECRGRAGSAAGNRAFPVRARGC